MLEPDVRRALEGTDVAHLVTLMPDGSPHTQLRCGSAPAATRSSSSLVPSSRKARNLRRDPRVALSLAPAENPFRPVIIRGQVTEWLDGDEARQVIDQLSTKYTGQPYSRSEERIVAVIEPERQIVGIG